MGFAFPLASSTLVPGLKLSPQLSAALAPTRSATPAPASSAASMAATSTSPSPAVATTRATVTAALMQLDRCGLVTQETTSWAPEYLYAALATATAAWATFLA